MQGLKSFATHAPFSQQSTAACLLLILEGFQEINQEREKHTRGKKKSDTWAKAKGVATRTVKGATIIYRPRRHAGQNRAEWFKRQMRPEHAPLSIYQLWPKEPKKVKEDLKSRNRESNWEKKQRKCEDDSSGCQAYRPAHPEESGGLQWGCQQEKKPKRETRKPPEAALCMQQLLVTCGYWNTRDLTSLKRDVV